MSTETLTDAVWPLWLAVADANDPEAADFCVRAALESLKCHTDEIELILSDMADRYENEPIMIGIAYA